MKTKDAFFLRLIGSLFALVLLAAPSLGVALIITQVEVVVGGAFYCDTTTACGNQIWNLGGGVNLSNNQTLILTQTGDNLGSQPRGGENFDSSDRGGNAALLACSNAGGTPCTVQIFINSGGGLVLVENDASGNANPLTARNAEPFSNTSLDTTFQEDAVWVPAPSFAGTGYTLDLGYADNIHGGSCNTPDCLPQSVWCSSPGGLPTTACPGAANFFIGAGLSSPPGIGNCLPSNSFGPTTHPPTDSAGTNVGCWDGGALRITARAAAVPEPSSLALLGVALAGLGGLRRRRTA